MNVFIARVAGKEAELTSEESWHCARVLRYKAGDRVQLIDGQGNFYEGELQLVSDRRCVAAILSGPRVQRDKGYRLHLAIAPTKQIDRMEWLLEKAVETGIDEVTFLLTKNSERTAVKPERLQKIVESAVKQSLQAKMPVLNNLTPLQKFLDALPHPAYIAHCDNGEKTLLCEVPFGGNDHTVLVGPEGDFTADELKSAMAVGCKPLDLGPNRLRTETAGLVICVAAALSGMRAVRGAR